MNSITPDASSSMSAATFFGITSAPQSIRCPMDVVKMIFAKLNKQAVGKFACTCRGMYRLVNHPQIKIPFLLRYLKVEETAKYMAGYFITSEGIFIPRDEPRRNLIREVLRVFMQSATVKQEKQWWSAPQNYVIIGRLMNLLPDVTKTFVFNRSYLLHTKEVTTAFTPPHCFRHLCEVELNISEARQETQALSHIPQFLRNFEKLRAVTIREFPHTVMPLPEAGNLNSLSSLKVCFSTRTAERTQWLLDLLSRANPLDRLVVREQEFWNDSPPGATTAWDDATPFPACMTRLKCLKVFSGSLLSSFLLKAALSEENRAPIEELECTTQSCLRMLERNDFETVIKPRLSSLKSLTIIFFPTDIISANNVQKLLECQRNSPDLQKIKLICFHDSSSQIDQLALQFELYLKGIFGPFLVTGKIEVEYWTKEGYQSKSNRKPYKSAKITL